MKRQKIMPNWVTAAVDRDFVALQKRAQGCIGVKLGGQASGLKPLGPARIEIIIDRA